MNSSRILLNVVAGFAFFPHKREDVVTINFIGELDCDDVRPTHTSLLGIPLFTLVIGTVFFVAILALVFGVARWRQPIGKIAVVISGFILLFFALVALLVLITVGSGSMG